MTQSPVNPRVSVIIPNYNYAKTLGLCLDAVYAQTHRPYEVIVVDDGSTDDSIEIARSRGATVIRTGGNYGPPAARNVGAAAATGDVLLFIDSDVALRRDATAVAVELMGTDPKIGAVCGGYEPEPLIRDSLVEEYRALQLAHWVGKDGPIGTTFTALLAVRATAFREVGGFNPRLPHTENADFGQRLCKRHTILLTHRMLGRHDHDDTVRMLLGKLFTRARLHVPLYLRNSSLEGGLGSEGKGWGAIAALLSLPALLLLVFGPWWAPVPAGLYVVSVFCETALYRFVRRERGPLFVLYFALMHYLANVTVAFAIGVGVLQWLCSAKFRGLYHELPEHAPAEATA